MMNIDIICNELQRIDGQATESAYGIRRIGELAGDSISRSRCDFSDQQTGQTLINALSLIQVSCDDAANSIGKITTAVHEIMAMIKK